MTQLSIKSAFAKTIMCCFVNRICAELNKLIFEKAKFGKYEDFERYTNEKNKIEIEKINFK